VQQPQKAEQHKSSQKPSPPQSMVEVGMEYRSRTARRLAKEKEKKTLK